MKSNLDLSEVVKGSGYLLRIAVFDALNRNGDYISYFSIKDYNLQSVEKEFSEFEGAKGEFYWVNEHTCPTNLIDTNTELYDGPYRDPHGVLILIGYLPENVIKEFVGEISKDENNKFEFGDGNGVTWGRDKGFFNFLLRLYKSLYHLVRSSYIYFSANEEPMDISKWGQPYYFTPFTTEYHSRINYLVCELLTKGKGLQNLVTIPKGRIIDVNQDVNEADPDTYNELIYGLPEYLFSACSGVGYERLKEILNFDNEFMCDEGDIIDSYYGADYIQKVLTTTKNE